MIGLKEDSKVGQRYASGRPPLPIYSASATVHMLAIRGLLVGQDQDIVGLPNR